MGSNQSIQDVEEEESEGEEEEEEDDDEHNNNGQPNIREVEGNHLTKKVLEQEPEILPCHASASPLSPQLSSLGTPRLGPSIKVWDPYNVLAPPRTLPPPLPAFRRSYSIENDREALEVYLISHGECDLNLRPDLVGGRCPMAALTPNGKRQAKALAVFLNSQGIRFSAVFCSPLDRTRSMAVSVCEEINFAVEQIQSSDELLELSMGQWEGCHQSEIYKPEINSLIERYQPDFSAPSGESFRQVEFRMVQFLNVKVLRLPEKLRLDESLHLQNESQGFSHENTHALVNSVHDRDGSSLPPPHWEMLHRHRHGLPRKKSGKSRLQFVSNIGEQDADDEVSPRVIDWQAESADLHQFNVNTSCSSSMPSCVGVFTHSLPIKCLVMGLIGCNPALLHKICIDDSSVTVLQHSWETGWQIKRLNDTAYLRLL